MSSITVIQNGNFQKIEALVGQNCLEILRREGYKISAPCGGSGKCGKCRVKMIKDGVGEEVLACRTEITGDCTIVLPDADTGGLIMSDAAFSDTDLSPREGFGAAVDIGTTTVVAKLFDLSDGRELGTESAWNAQGPYGADVLSRCQYCMEHEDGLEHLSGLIRGQLDTMIDTLCAKAGIEKSAVKEICLAGNTVMQHIFASLSPVSIALAPFTPQSLFDIAEPELSDTAELCYAPCVAGYVGGDITAGLLATDIAKKHDKALFLDVGTNGEMALGGRDGFVSCAVACGPAFEGAGISCGMTSTEGAISHVEWDEGFKFTVIGGGKPKGICGSGLIDLMAVLVEKGLVDEGGLLLPPDEAPEGFEAWLDEDENGNGLLFLTEDDSVYFTAADVRQLQLAKAAVAAGITVLLHDSGLALEDVEALYLAGGFGSHMRAESAVKMGMLPGELLDRIICVGNASLAGARQALLSLEKRKELYAIQKSCAYHELSGSAAFNEAYLAHMSFDEEETEWNLLTL